MGDAKRRRVAAQRRKPLQERRVGRADQEGCEQRIFLRARGCDVIDRRRSMPVAASTMSTRSAGTRVQFEPMVGKYRFAAQVR
jgi:hypothetical protein